MSKLSPLFRKLKGHLREMGWDYHLLSKKSGIPRSTLAGKLSGSATFTLDEIHAIICAMNLPSDEMHLYFPDERESILGKANKKLKGAMRNEVR